MLAKVAPVAQGRIAFSALLGYIETAGTRLALRGHGIEDLASAGAEMDAVAARNARCATPACHFLLVWEEGQKPGVENVFALAEHAVGKLGLADHQHVVAIHDERGCRHCHIAVNRVHPITLKAAHVEFAQAALREAVQERDGTVPEEPYHRIGVARWSLEEALDQACAALPDYAFAERYGIAARTMKDIQGVVDDLRAQERTGTQTVNPMDVLIALTKAHNALPLAWPENPPLDVFAAVEASLVAGYQEVLADYPSTQRIGERYDEDALFAEAVNRLVPGFEYPDWSHRTVEDVLAFANERARDTTSRMLAERDIPVVDNGRYIGKVVASRDGFIVQDAGRGALVAHDARKWDVAPEVGEQCDVIYSGKDVRVSRQAQREVASAGQER